MSGLAWNYRALPACANCGKDHGGFMNSSTWSHSFSCCSEACGRRLGHKLKHDMGGVHPKANPWGDEGFDGPEDRIASLRLEIKLLRKRLQAATRPPEDTER